jgi:hypothetical protein
LASSDEPPKDMNGRVTPVRGSTRMTPPMIRKDWTPSSAVRPVASSFSKGCSVRSATRRPQPISST